MSRNASQKLGFFKEENAEFWTCHWRSVVIHLNSAVWQIWIRDQPHTTPITFPWARFRNELPWWLFFPTLAVSNWPRVCSTLSAHIIRWQYQGGMTSQFQEPHVNMVALYALHFGATEAPNHQTAGSGISLWPFFAVWDNCRKCSNAAASAGRRTLLWSSLGPKFPTELCSNRWKGHDLGPLPCALGPAKSDKQIPSTSWYALVLSSEKT